MKFTCIFCGLLCDSLKNISCTCLDIEENKKCTHCNSELTTIENDGFLCCSNCGVCVDIDITNSFEGNIPTNSKNYRYYMQRFMNDPNLKPRQSLYSPVKHMQKIIRIIEGNHRMHIPLNLLEYLKKNCEKFSTPKKIRQKLKAYPGGNKYLPHIPYFKNYIDGTFFHFPERTKEDLCEIYSMIVKVYKEDDFVKKNKKKLPPITFTIIQILLWLESNYVLPYNVWEFFPELKNLKGKQKKVNLDILENVLICIKFDYDKITNYEKKSSSKTSCSGGGQLQ